MTLQIVISNYHFDLNFYDLNLFDNRKLFFIKSLKINVVLKNLKEHVLIYLDRRYDEIEKNETRYTNNRHYIQRILHVKDFNVRSLRQLFQTHDKFKIIYFDREMLAEVFDKPHIFFLYFLFIDDFSVHRNIYCVLKTFYFISTCLSYKKRRKIVNVFTLILNSHEINFDEIMKFFNKHFRQLNRKMNLIINATSHIMCAFIIVFLNDMSQQANNKDFARHNINMKD